PDAGAAAAHPGLGAAVRTGPWSDLADRRGMFGMASYTLGYQMLSQKVLRLRAGPTRDQPLRQTYSPPAATSARASSRLLAGSGLPWKFTSPSLRSTLRTPWPLWVNATMQLGRPWTALARSRALRTSRRSLPLMTWVFQPKAVNLPSIGSMFRTSSAAPVC